MKFKNLKEWLAEKAIDETAYAAKTATEMAALQKEYLQYVSEAIKAHQENGISKDALAEAIKGLVNEEAIKGFMTKESTEFKALEKRIEEAEEKAAMAIEGNKSGDIRGEALVKEISENKESLKNIAKGGPGEIELKALTTRASVANSPAGFVLPDIGQLGVKERSLYNVLPKVRVTKGNHTGTVRYRDWDEATTVRAAAMVAEGAAFPESTAKFAWYTKDLRKVGDTLPVTEEFFEDEEQAAAELERFLDINVSTKIDDQLVNGDNTGQNLDGIINSAPAFVAQAGGVQYPNLKDLAIKVRNDITRSRGSKYRPDMVLVASSTMEDLVLAKDQNGNYIFDESTGTLGGLAVVVDENMPDNQIVVGDRRYATIYEMDGVMMSNGMAGNQFLEDEMTLKARKRMLLLVRTVDKTGFRKVADVDAALTTIGS